MYTIDNTLFKSSSITYNINAKKYFMEGMKMFLIIGALVVIGVIYLLLKRMNPEWY
mgnify:CR=1 FL=1